MSWFGRVMKLEHGYDGTFAAKGKGAPPPHLRDKNMSHSGQGGKASTAYADEGADLTQDQGDGSNGSMTNQDEEQADADTTFQ